MILRERLVMIRKLDDSIPFQYTFILAVLDSIWQQLAHRQ